MVVGSEGEHGIVMETRVRGGVFCVERWVFGVTLIRHCKIICCTDKIYVSV